MTTPRSAGTAEPSLTRDLIHVARYYLGNRRGLLVLAGLAIVAGLTLNWSWLAAAGVAPILISVLPCLAMCALGLCMTRGSGSSCSSAAKGSGAAAADDAVPVGAVALAVPHEPAAPGPQVGAATPLANLDPQPSNERKQTNA